MCYRSSALLSSTVSASASLRFGGSCRLSFRLVVGKERFYHVVRSVRPRDGHVREHQRTGACDDAWLITRVLYVIVLYVNDKHN